MKKIISYLYVIVDYIKYEVHNPYSAMTNLAYIWFGWLRSYNNPVLGGLMILLGIASTGFHMTRTNHGHKADIIAIYYVFAVVGGWLGLDTVGLFFGFLLGGIAHGSFTDYSRYSQEIIGTLGIFCLIPYGMYHGFGPLTYMLMWFFLAFGVSLLATYYDPEEEGIWYDCFHSIWHIFSGIGIYFLTEPKD